MLIDDEKLIDPGNGVFGLPSSAHGSYGFVFVMSLSAQDDRGASYYVGQVKRSSATGVLGSPTSAYGSYGDQFETSLDSVTDLGFTIQEKTPVASGFFVPTPIIGVGGKTTYYSMRRTDTGAVGGYAHWVNTTGDATGAPAAIGTVGSPVIITTF